MLPDMYLCASTIDGASFQQRLEAASAAGYAGIGLRPSHYQAARAEGRSETDLRRLLEDHGLELTEIGFLAGWWESGDLAARSRAHEDQLYRLKGSLGGRHMMLIGGPLRSPSTSSRSVSRRSATGPWIMASWSVWSSCPGPIRPMPALRGRSRRPRAAGTAALSWTPGITSAARPTTT